ncbi:pentapeptide repeat-containing protein [Phyllobacterium sp. 628]|uniref:pentapeptide repeat-containing protein n=1 Tax=Phyllobacterium sp. 628 TaxID=2718938 RepID=UPI0035300B89
MLHIFGNTKRRDVGLTFAAACFMLAMVPNLASAADCGSTAAPGLDWSECNKRNIIIPDSNLEGANLSGTDFTWTDLSGANVKSANFEKSGLMKSSLAKAKASNANFNRVEAYRSNFSNISAENATFNSSELQRSNFSAANLKGASFERAELGRANFQKSDLSGVQFSFANLSRADLTGAVIDGTINFDKAFMFRTRIEGLNLTMVQGLQQAQIDLACGDNATKLPRGLSAPPSWPCPADDPD